MKISALTRSLGYVLPVREKKDGTFASHLITAEADSKSGTDHNKDHDQKEKSEEKPDQKQIDDAIEAFHFDKQAQENGLKASLSGNGPGLKVILKDCQGSVVRQLTGEEFLKMRLNASKDDRICGKILDQKL